MFLLYIPILSIDPITSFMTFLSLQYRTSLGSGIRFSCHVSWSRTGPQHFFAFCDMEIFEKYRPPHFHFFNIKIYPIILCLSDISPCWTSSSGMLHRWCYVLRVSHLKVHNSVSALIVIRQSRCGLIIPLYNCVYIHTYILYNFSLYS